MTPIPYNVSPGRLLPRNLPVLLHAARDAPSARAVAGVLLRVYGHVRVIALAHAVGHLVFRVAPACATIARGAG